VRLERAPRCAGRAAAHTRGALPPVPQRCGSGACRRREVRALLRRRAATVGAKMSLPSPAAGRPEAARLGLGDPTLGSDSSTGV